MSLGKRSGGGNAIYLNIAGGSLWQRKDKSGNFVSTDHEDYCEEKYTMSDGEEKTRKGLKYSFIEGTVKGYYFYQGDYGEMVNVMIDDGEETYTVSAGIDNRFGGDLLKMLITFDPEKDVEITPFDFEGDRGRVRGCSVKQEGKKLTLLPSPTEPMGLEFKSSEELKKMGSTTIGKKKRDLYFANQTEEIKELALEAVGHLLSEKKEDSKDDKVADKKEKPVKKSGKKSGKSDILKKHKKRLAAYAEEEYSRELPEDLTDEEIEEWYQLSINDEELPFDKYDQKNEEVEQEETEDDDSEAESEGKSAVEKLKEKLAKRKNK